MSLQLYSVVEVVALVVGVAGPIWALLREVWRSEWLASIWERQSVLAAIFRELLLLVCLVGIVVGYSVILDLALRTALIPSPLYDVLRHTSSIVGISLVGAVVARAAHQAVRHFHERKGRGESTPTET